MRSLKAEIAAVLARRDIWLTLAWFDVRRLYRRSVLGPFWLTLSTAVLVLGIGYLYGGLFGQPVADYLPFVAAGIVTWGLIAGVLQAGSQALIADGAILKQVPASALTPMLRSVAAQVFIFLHSLGVLLVVALLFGRASASGWLAGALGLVLVIFNLTWMAVIAGIASLRFRDAPPIIAAILQFAFFVTPVIWAPGSLPSHTHFLELNPFFHFLAITRDPLIGLVVPMPSVLISLALLFAGTGAACLLFSSTRHRIVYWL